ncbi:hypothetical protein EYC80_009119 [Monilinia laxa]|nr:hypothetical protein EYC80_009119 [Monilinia laxa]
MPHLPTAQEWLTQSSLLLKAHPSTTRITTKYTILLHARDSPHAPSTTHSTATKPRLPKPKPQSDTAAPTPEPPRATLTITTFHPQSGVNLKYTTNKAAEKRKRNERNLISKIELTNTIPKRTTHSIPTNLPSQHIQKLQNTSHRFPLLTLTIPHHSVGFDGHSKNVDLDLVIQVTCLLFYSGENIYSEEEAGRDVRYIHDGWMDIKKSQFYPSRHCLDHIKSASQYSNQTSRQTNISIIFILSIRSSDHGMPPNHDIPFNHPCPNDCYDSYSSIPPNQIFPTPQLLHAKILFVHKPHTHRHLCMQAPRMK